VPEEVEEESEVEEDSGEVHTNNHVQKINMAASEEELDCVTKDITRQDK
jgi:hypothetical protein